MSDDSSAYGGYDDFGGIEKRNVSDGSERLSCNRNKLAENSTVPEELRVKAREFVREFNSLLPVRGKGTATQHFQDEQLIAKIARFLPRILEVQAYPAIARE